MCAALAGFNENNHARLNGMNQTAKYKNTFKKTLQNISYNNVDLKTVFA